MKKIIERTRRFEKSFGRLNVKTQKLFIKKLGIFIDNEYSPSLKIHRLKGKRKNEYAFSVNGKEILVFTFVDIGGHNKVY
ncbi:MAG: type II toxin-antitoxin system mRNA interferase toxin, RelE/StbE family [Candidatus Peregrinibacteria bacterium]